MSERAEEGWLQSGLGKTVVGAVIAGVFSLVVASVNGCFSAKPIGAKKSITFVGRVSNNANSPIAGATVFATQDQSPGQGILTDSYGQFQIELPAETKFLSLIVSADGFATETLEGNIHRTGAETIYLHRLPAPKADAQSPASKQSRKRELVTKTDPPAPQPQTSEHQQQPNQGIVNNNSPNQGVQNVCEAGVVGCDQSIHIRDLPPLPAAILYAPQPIAAEDKTKPASQQPFQSPGENEGPLKFNPGFAQTVGVDRIFDNASFEFACDVPCIVTRTWYGHQSGSQVRSSPISPVDAVATNDMLHHRVYFSQKLSPGGDFISITVRSQSSAPVKVTSLFSIQPE